MANKHLLFTLLPLALCDLSTKLFREEIVNTGAEPFFDSFFKTLRASDGNIKCAFFDLENTIINGSIAKAIFAYQLREIEFAFKKEDVRPIFGFEDAFTSSIDTPYHSCVPDSFIFSNTVVNLDSIVNDIEYLYDDRRKPTHKKKFRRSLPSGIAWSMHAFQRSKDVNFWAQVCAIDCYMEWIRLSDRR